MGKKINIQRDLQSRRDISEKNSFPEVYIKPEITEEYAESKTDEEQETDAEPKKKEVPKKEEGRPKGTYKRYLFEETRLGFMLKYEVPAVFDIIMKMTSASMCGEPPLLLVKTVCKSSDDPSLKKPKFFRYLEEYAWLGLYCKRPKILTPERAAYYTSVRKKKLEVYINKNKDQISTLINYERKPKV
ncbi:MAG: hypothetical protein LBQ74_20510 [Prevotella sp.]|jgi:hypothetical protein|nr:hypothetical protein [Prevotella sp.]